MVRSLQPYCISLNFCLYRLFFFLFAPYPAALQQRHSAMPHPVPNFTDPIVREVVLHTWDKHRHNSIKDGRVVVPKGKYKAACAELLADFGLLVTSDYLKTHHVSVTWHTAARAAPSTEPCSWGCC